MRRDMNLVLDCDNSCGAVEKGGEGVNRSICVRM